MNKKPGSEWPLRWKFLASGLAPVLVVLVIGSIGFAAYDLVSFRKSLLSNLQGVAHFISLTTRAALQFDRPEYASRILAGLESSPDVVRACIYNSDGEIFVKYPEDAASDFPQVINREPTPKSRMWVFQPMQLDNGQQIGTVFIEADFERFQRRLWIMLGGLVVSILLLAALAYYVAARLQAHILRPFTALAETAGAIAREKDYSVRVPAEAGPEFGLMTNAFNHMLEQIEKQDEKLKEHARELQTANQELEAFTYTVSHDLRSPLRAMVGFSHLLNSQFGDQLSPEAREYTQRIHKGAMRMSELIDDLLAFSRVDAEPLQKQSTDVARLAREVFQNLSAQLNGRKINFKVQEVPPAEADPSLLEQALVNLLSNAIKYSRHRAVTNIEIGSMQESGKMVYFVKDDGAGFDMKFAPKLFGIFQRLHKNEEFEGTGVGLAIVKRILERHGGRIWAEGELNKGATFYFTLN